MSNFFNNHVNSAYMQQSFFNRILIGKIFKSTFYYLLFI